MSNSKSGARDPLTINGKPEILIYKKSRPRQTGVATSLSRCVVKYSMACPAGSCKCFSTTSDFFRKSFDLCLPPGGEYKNPGLGSRFSVLRREGRRAKPTCVCAVRWFEAQPEEQDLLA